MMNYMSQASIFYSYAAITTFSTFLRIMFRVAGIMRLEEMEEKKPIENSVSDIVKISFEKCYLS